MKDEKNTFEQEKNESGKETGKLQVEHLVLGQVATNCYLAMNRDTRELILVDPADEAGRIRRKVQEMGGIPAAILLTHGHFDHIGAVDELRRVYGIPCYASEAEAEVLSSPEWNLSRMFGHPLTVEADVLLKDGQELTLAGKRIRVLHTPGHTKGGACYYFPEDGLVFSGDTLFAGSVGRTDFPTGSSSVLVRSVREKLFILPEETIVYPGHDRESSIGYEKRYNPFA